MVSDSWQAHANRAATTGDIGALLLLADEAQPQRLRAHAWIEATKLLRADGHGDFARELLERALNLDAENPQIRQLRQAPHAIKYNSPSVAACAMPAV